MVDNIEENNMTRVIIATLTIPDDMEQDGIDALKSAYQRRFAGDGTLSITVDHQSVFEASPETPAEKADEDEDFGEKADNGDDGDEDEGDDD